MCIDLCYQNIILRRSKKTNLNFFFKFTYSNQITKPWLRWLCWIQFQVNSEVCIDVTDWCRWLHAKTYFCVIWITPPNMGNIIICSSYIALFLVKASSKSFAFYYPWQTCYINHLLNFLGSIHPLAHFKAPRVIQVQFPFLSITRYSFMAEWTEAPLLSPGAHAGLFWSAHWFMLDSNPPPCGWESHALTIRPSQPDTTQ